MTHVPDASVPCGSCTRCCVGEAIVLLPSHGDRLEAYPEAEEFSPGLWRIPHKPDSDECLHLTAMGCAIHEHAPQLCRSFDCRQMFQMHRSLPRAERMARLAKVNGLGALLRRGRDLLEGKP